MTLTTNLRETFAAFYESTASSMNVYAWTLVRWSALAPSAGEDIVQDAFLSVWEVWSGIAFQPDPARRSYLRTTVKNRFLDLCRKSRTTKRSGLDESVKEGEDGCVDLIELAPESFWSQPSSDAEKQGLFKELLDMVRSLPEGEKRMMYLRYLEELTVEEIGTVFGVNKSTVVRKLKNVMEELRDRLSSQALKEII